MAPNLDLQHDGSGKCVSEWGESNGLNSGKEEIAPIQ